MSDVVSDPSIVPGGDDVRKDSVSYEEHKRLLAQRKADQAKLEQISQELSEFKARESKLQDEKNKSEGNWTAVVEAREAKLREKEEEARVAKEKVEHLEGAFNHIVKVQAFQNKLGAKFKKPEYVDFVDVNKIPLDASGKIDEQALETYANTFANQYKELLSFQDKGHLPGGAPAAAKDLSYSQWLKLPLAEKKARMKDVKK